MATGSSGFSRLGRAAEGGTGATRSPTSKSAGRAGMIIAASRTRPSLPEPAIRQRATTAVPVARFFPRGPVSQVWGADSTSSSSIDVTKVLGPISSKQMTV